MTKCTRVCIGYHTRFIMLRRGRQKQGACRVHPTAFYQGETMKSPLQPGRYRHYKGRFYEVIDVARHSETEELLVVYRCLYGDASLWVRPLEMFMDTVDVDGERVARFARCPLQAG